MPANRAGRASRRFEMSDTHKEALARGRAESNAVRRYLEALASTRSGRGRKRSRDALERRLESVEQAAAATADPLGRLHRAQEVRDLRSELARMAAEASFVTLEREFVRVAKSYGERRGISYGTWRAVGVSAAVLEKAGIRRSGG
jgi:hypothetical protein